MLQSNILAEMVSAEQAGFWFWKPDPRAYAYALSRCGVQAAEAMLVSGPPVGTPTAHGGPAYPQRGSTGPGSITPATSAPPRLKWSH
jgi:hypothetical protein